MDNQNDRREARDSRDMVTRIDERTRTTQEDVKEMKSSLKDFISRVEFITRLAPLERLVYGLVAIILLAVIGAIIGQVIK